MDDKSLSSLNEKFRKSAITVETNHKKWENFYKYYRSVLTTTYNDYSKKRILPIAFSTIMSIMPRILLMKPKIRYIMRKYPEYIDDIFSRLENDVPLEIKKEEAVTFMDSIIKWQWRNFNGDIYLQKNILHTLIYGTGIIRVGWNKDKNMPQLEAIEPFYFYPNPECTDPFDMEWCIIRSFISKDRYKELSGKDAGNTYGGDDISLYKDSVDPFNASGKGGDLIEIFEYYDKKEIIIFTKEEIISRAENPISEIPVVVNYNYVPEQGFWGMSEIDQIEQFIKDATDFRNNRHINIELTTNSMWQIDPNKEVWIEDLVSAPGQIIRAEDGALKPLVPPNMTSGLYQEDVLLKNDIRETSGISDYMRGGTPQRFETATAIDNLVSSGNARINMRLINMQHYLIYPLGRILIEMNKKFLKPLNITVKSDNGINSVSIDTGILKMIDTDYDIIVIPNNIDKNRKEEFIQLLQIIMSNPDIYQRFNIDEFMKVMLKMWNIPTYNIFNGGNNNGQPSFGQAAGQEGQFKNPAGNKEGGGIPAASDIIQRLTGQVQR